MKENLSALLDNELEDRQAQQVLDRLHADGDLRDEFALQVAIGDALRGDIGLDAAFTASVMSRLDDEPTVLAPVAHRTAAIPRRMWMSAAAAVSGVALVSWLGLDLMPAGAPVQMAATASTASYTPQARVSGVSNESPLRAYMVAHHGYSPTGSMQGVALYARGVSDVSADDRR
ncbi:MAG: anti-sigma 24 factor [Methyloversatilis sp. 12-65-5]|nr:MAG: anti-sigma 24 factor [Methyloversatilis sp. 12-65-5]